MVVLWPSVMRASTTNVEVWGDGRRELAAALGELACAPADAGWQLTRLGWALALHFTLWAAILAPVVGVVAGFFWPLEF